MESFSLTNLVQLLEEGSSGGHSTLEVGLLGRVQFSDVSNEGVTGFNIHSTSQRVLLDRDTLLDKLKFGEFLDTMMRV